VHAVAIAIDEAFERVAALFKEAAIAPAAQAAPVVFFARYIVVFVVVGIDDIIDKTIAVSIDIAPTPIVDTVAILVAKAVVYTVFIFVCERKVVRIGLLVDIVYTVAVGIAEAVVDAVAVGIYKADRRYCRFICLGDGMR
jgi:hypothetical protein